MPFPTRAMLSLAASLLMWSAPALAGPPYLTDDPEPTDQGHFEIYGFADGASARAGSGGESGIDFNYGGAKDLQLTAVIPVGWSMPGAGSGGSASLGNIELAAKYKILHQDDVGVDVAVFPRVFLPAGSPSVGRISANMAGCSPTR